MRASLEAVAVEVAVGDVLLYDVSPPISLVKVDVEGAEPLVLRGMRTTLQSNPQSVLIFEFFPPYIVNFGEDPMSFLVELESCGFKLSVLGGGSRNPVEADPSTIMKLGNSSKRVLNVLAVPKV